MTEAEPEQTHTWVRTGATYGAVADGKIVALVYHAAAQHGEGEGGDRATGPGWFLVWTHEPHRHLQLPSPPLAVGIPHERREEIALVALADAGKVIDEKLAPESS